MGLYDQFYNGASETKVYDYIKGMPKNVLVNAIKTEYERMKGTYPYAPEMGEYGSFEFAGALMIWRYCRENVKQDMEVCGGLMITLGENLGCAYNGMPAGEWSDRMDRVINNNDLLNYTEWNLIYNYLKYTVGDEIHALEFNNGNVDYSKIMQIYTNYIKVHNTLPGYTAIFNYYTRQGLRLRCDMPFKILDDEGAWEAATVEPEPVTVEPEEASSNDIDKALSNLRKLMGQTELFGQSNAKKIQELIDAGYEVNVLDENGYTPLITCNSLEGIKVLIKNGADVNYSKTVSAMSQWKLTSEITHYLFGQGALFNRYRAKDFPYDEYSCKYDEATDVYRRNLALVFKSRGHVIRISYQEASKRCGGAEALNRAINEAHQTFLETKEIIPFEVINGEIYSYLL